MTTPDIDFELLDGVAASERADELLAVHAEVYAEPPHRWDQDRDAWFAGRFAVQRRQPGFVLAVARHGEYLVGYAFGLPLRSSTDWWRQLTTPLPAELTTEFPGRSFAVADLLVRAPWRRQGIGETLYGLLIRGRREERATAAVPVGAVAAQEAFQCWGWQKVARRQDSAPDSPLLDLLVRPLPGGR